MKNVIKPLSLKELTRKENIIIIVIPTLFLALGFHLLKLFGPLSLRHGDPDYIYLLSGLSMGNLHLNVGHVDNPGTPLQIIVALVTRVVHLFAGEGSYSRDLLLRPDFYLDKVLIFNYILVGCFLIYLGYKANVYLKKWYYAPLLQTMMFSSWTIIYNTTTVIPEVVISIPVILLLIQFLKYYSSGDNYEFTYKDTIKLAIIGGLGLSVKLDYLPLLFLPVFLLKQWKLHVLYWPGIVFSFLCFAFPVLHKRKFFFDWVKGLVVHSGKYGSGASNFVDIHSFLGNFHSILNFYLHYYIVFASLVIILVLLFLQRQNRHRHFQIRIVAGLLLTVLFATLLVSKHFGLNYLMPILYLFPFCILFILESIHFDKNIRAGLAMAVSLFILFAAVNQTKHVLKWKVPQLETKLEVSQKVKNMVGNNPFLIVDQPYNFYFHESPLLFGWFFQGRYQTFLKDRMLNTYPDTYVYDWGKKKFFLWGDLFSEKEILNKYHGAYLFINGNMVEKNRVLLSTITSHSSIRCIYENKETKDILYEVKEKEE